MTVWSSGKINGYTYDVKSFQNGSQYGIGGNGRISKLSIRKDGIELYNYERGLDFDRLNAAGKEVYAQILERYN